MEIPRPPNLKHYSCWASKWGVLRAQKKVQKRIYGQARKVTSPVGPALGTRILQSKQRPKVHDFDNLCFPSPFLFLFVFVEESTSPPFHSHHHRQQPDFLLTYFYSSNPSFPIAISSPLWSGATVVLPLFSGHFLLGLSNCPVFYFACESHVVCGVSVVEIMSKKPPPEPLDFFIWTVEVSPS